jgi:hypothetical protein
MVLMVVVVVVVMRKKNNCKRTKKNVMNKYEQDILKEGEHVGSGKPFVLPVCQLCEKRRILR